MSVFSPIVCKPTLLVHFVYYVLHNHATPTTLVICSERASFLAHLCASASSFSERHSQDAETLDGQEREQQHPLLASDDIRTIFASQSITIAFCGSVPTLHAYLTTLPGPNTTPWPRLNKSSDQGDTPDDTQSHSNNHEGIVPVLAIVNAVRLHVDTTTFSAQGLSRAFAAAVEAAERSGQQLVLFESLDQPPEHPSASLRPWSSFHPIDAEDGEEDEEYDGYDGDEDYYMAAMEMHSLAQRSVKANVDADSAVPLAQEDTDVLMAGIDDEDESNQGDGGDETTTAGKNSKGSDQDDDPWAIEIPLLNTTTKAYGTGATRGKGWIGKRVTAADVAARWCTFEELLTNQQD